MSHPAAAALAALCAGIARLFTAAAIAILAAILAVNALEIVSRSWLSLSFGWIYEINLLLASWMYFLGIVLVYRHGGDVTMVGLRSVLPARLRRLFDQLLGIVAAGVFLVVAWEAWALIELQWPFRTPGVGIPRAAFTAPLLIGAAAVVLQLIEQVVSPGTESGARA